MQKGAGGNFQAEMAKITSTVNGLQEEIKNTRATDANSVGSKRVGWQGVDTTQQISWNDIFAGGGVQIEVDQVQEDGDTNDLTVDKWNFKQSCWDASAFIFHPQLMTCPESLYDFCMLLAK
jgi:hypothetical protein